MENLDLAKTQQFQQSFRDGGIVRTITRSAEWLLKNLIKTAAQKNEQWGDFFTSKYDTFKSDYQIATKNTWIDHEADNGLRVCWQNTETKGASQIFHVRQTSPAEALEQMALIEKLFAEGKSAAQVYDEVEVVCF